jgi:hypothetical protein
MSSKDIWSIATVRRAPRTIVLGKGGQLIGNRARLCRTYNIPNAKQQIRAILFIVGIRNCHTVEMGRIKIRRSVATSTTPLDANAAGMFPQVPPGVVGSQNMRSGRHITRPVMTVKVTHERERAMAM